MCKIAQLFQRNNQMEIELLEVADKSFYFEKKCSNFVRKYAIELNTYGL